MDYQLFFTKLLQAQTSSPSKSTIKNYRADLGQFISWYEKRYKKPFSPEKITSETLTKYETTSKLSSSSHKRHVAAIKKFYALLSENNYHYTPFKEAEKKNAIEIGQIDNFLSRQGISPITAKNYLSDIRTYLMWSNLVTRNGKIADQLSTKTMKEYQERLLAQGTPISTVNRKAASLKKLQEFAVAQSYIPRAIYQPVQPPANTEAKSLTVDEMMKLSENGKEFSKVPPVRLFQRLTRPYFELEDHIATLIAIKLKKGAKSINNEAKATSTSFITYPTTLTKQDESRRLYAPITAPRNAPLQYKLLHHAQHTRPKWYRRYHSFTASHYLHFGLLIVGTIVIGFILYQNTIGGIFAKEQAYAAPAPPPKILAFQGTLTDSKNIPITTPTTVYFNIYASEFSTDTNSLWQESQVVSPDSTGSFTVYLGTTIPLDTQIFAQNNQLFLGVTVQGGEELTPRQRLASVAYASNSEFLQGMAPINQSSDTKNTVLVLNSQGNLVIPHNASTKFHATGGNITLSGQATIITTNEASNGNIVLSPNGTGGVDIQGGIINTSQTGALYPGSVTISDTAVISATSSGTPTFTLLQGGTGNIFTASSSGATRFVIDSQGRVGINVSQPTDTLDINGSIYLQGGGGRIYGDQLSLQSTGTSPLLIQPSSLSTNNVGIGSTSPTAFVDIQGGTSSTPLLELNYTASGQNIINAQTSGSTVFVLAQTGNIGLGTTNTSSVINLASSTSASGGLLFGSDTNLYRSGTSTLTTDDSLTIGTDLTVSGTTTFNGVSYTWPASDGTSGQVLTTDSAGQLSWTNNGAGVWQEASGALHPLTLTHDIFLGGSDLSSALIRLAGTSGQDSWLNTGGNLGVGTTTPAQTLDVQGNIQANLTGSASTNGVCHSGAPSDTTATDVDLVVCSSAPADIAEWYAADLSVDSGYITELTSTTLTYSSEGSDAYTGQVKNLGEQEISILTKATNPEKLLGIVSTGPYQTIGSDIKKGLENNPNYKAVPVALAGRVLLKIAYNSPPISPGDPITLSSTPGKGKKATEQGLIVARALESWDKDKDQILVYVQPTWYQPVTIEENISINKDISGNYQIKSSGSILENALATSTLFAARITAGAIIAREITISGTLQAGEIIATRLKVGSVEAKEISTNALALTSNRLSIQGQSLDEYIDERISKAQKKVSPQLPEVKTDALTTLFENEPENHNSASTQDNLITQNPSTQSSESANPSSNPQSPTVNSLENKDSSASSSLIPENHSTASSSLTTDSNGLLDLPSHKSPFAIFNQGLTSFGPATFEQITTMNSIDVGSGSQTLTLTDTSINTLTPLEIQPFAQAGVEFMGGKITIDTQGNMVVNGNSLINGTLAAVDAVFENKVIASNIQVGTLSPLPENDLAIRLGKKADGSSQKIQVQNESGQSVLSIDNEGNIEASGTATLSKLKFWEPDTAYAEVSQTEIQTSGSAGEASIKAYQKELTIHNTQVTEKSLIYLTPAGNTEDKVVFLLRQSPGESFTVGIASSSKKDVKFNWLIVN